MRPVAIVQARMQSTRLPGKVLADLGGQPMLGQVLDRVAKAHSLRAVVVATSTLPADDAIQDFCQRRGVVVHRGSESDVLARYHKAASAEGADPVIRLTADCPLMDAEIIDRVLVDYEQGGADYVSNVAPPTYPDGLDVECFSFAALDRAFKEARLPSQREHVTPYLRETGLFRTRNVRNDEDLSGMRWTVDRPEDLAFVQAIVRRLGPDAGWRDIVELLRREPGLAASNQGLPRNEGYQKSLRQDPRQGP